MKEAPLTQPTVSASPAKPRPWRIFVFLAGVLVLAGIVKQEEANRRAEEERKKPENVEAAAAIKLKLIKVLLDDGKKDLAKFRLEQMVKDFPNTKAAGEAKKMLEQMDKE